MRRSWRRYERMLLAPHERENDDGHMPGNRGDQPRTAPEKIRRHGEACQRRDGQQPLMGGHLYERGRADRIDHEAQRHAGEKRDEKAQPEDERCGDEKRPAGQSQSPPCERNAVGEIDQRVSDRGQSDQNKQQDRTEGVEAQIGGLRELKGGRGHVGEDMEGMAKSRRNTFGRPRLSYDLPLCPFPASQSSVGPMWARVLC